VELRQSTLASLLRRYAAMSEQLTFHRGGTNPDTSLEADRPKAEVGAARAATDHDASYLRVFVFALFFFFGGITSLNDVIIPKSRPSPARAARRCGGWPQWRCAFGRAEGVSLSLASARLQWRAVILRPCVGKWSKRANSRQTIRVDARWTLYRDGVYWDCYIKPTPPQSCDA
jgi:hypothetical protein